MASIVAVLVLALVTVGLLVWVSPSSARAKLKAAAPRAFTVVIIAMPLMVWAASSGGGEESLIVERSTALTGAPELLVSLADKDLNTLNTTKGKTTVRLECVDREGHVVLDAEHRWPLLLERGYDYPHAHQVASLEKVQQADRCRLGGTRIRLETEVEGALTG
ncbi:MAG: hypothetical protein ACRDPC_07720 [Solirubrobacteraceae bacterium]